MFSKNEATPINSKKVETIIGPSVKVEGNFKGEGDLLIDGILVGSLSTENNLKIGAGAVIDATVRAKNAFISGKVKGNLTISGKLELSGTAVILGDIKAQTLSMESGAMIQGKMSMPAGKITIEESAKDSELPPMEEKMAKPSQK